ncbi:MAG: hypothetical protein EBR23_07710 [Planctomycetia bacterium]|nr:hypothetical protein [Planctomycetia bacterium]
MQCNIDNRGRVARILSGILTAAAGTGLLAGWVMQTLPGWTLWAALAAFAGGAFMVFEGVKGWCVMRAMGFKTPM